MTKQRIKLCFFLRPENDSQDLFELRAQFIRLLSLANNRSAFTTPRVHALVYDPSVGKLESLDVDFKAILDEFSSDYDIYGRNSMTIKGTKRDEARIKEKPREAAP